MEDCGVTQSLSVKDPFSVIATLLAFWLFTDVDLIRGWNEMDSGKIRLFEKFYDITPQNTTFPIMPKFLELFENLSPEEAHAILDKLREFCKHECGLNYYLLSLSGASLKELYLEVINDLNWYSNQALSAINSFAGDYKFIKNLGEEAIDNYKKNSLDKDKIAYKDWKGKMKPTEWEEALERKMGSYLEDVIQTDYLKKYRSEHRACSEDTTLYAGNCIFHYNKRSFLEMQYCPYYFYWTSDEAVELSILEDYSLLWWEPVDGELSYQVGKLIYDNRERYKDEESITKILRFYYMTKFVAEDLETMRSKMDECIFGIEYYLEKELPDIPAIFTIPKAIKVWDAFVEAGYLMKKSKRYCWIKDKTEFGVFVVKAHKYLPQFGIKKRG